MKNHRRIEDAVTPGDGTRQRLARFIRDVATGREVGFLCFRVCAEPYSSSSAETVITQAMNETERRLPSSFTDDYDIEMYGYWFVHDEGLNMLRWYLKQILASPHSTSVALAADTEQGIAELVAHPLHTLVVVSVGRSL